MRQEQIVKQPNYNLNSEDLLTNNDEAVITLHTPEAVYDAILHNPVILRWHTFISKEYIFPRKKILLVYPCSATKPFTKSRSYVSLFKMLRSLEPSVYNQIHLATISEPFGLIPSEFYGEPFAMYDCPGLFKWWCSKHNVSYDVSYVNKSIFQLSRVVGESINRAITLFGYSKVVGFVRTYSSGLEIKFDHTHRRILEGAKELFNFGVDILPGRRQVENIVNKSGRFAWDMYGPAHPVALKNLFDYLSGKH